MSNFSLFGTNSSSFRYTELPGFAQNVPIKRHLHFLPQSWNSKMGPSNSSYLSNRAIFHFHDYGRNGSPLVVMLQTHHKCRSFRVPSLMEVISHWLDLQNHKGNPKKKKGVGPDTFHNNWLLNRDPCNLSWFMT